MSGTCLLLLISLNPLLLISAEKFILPFIRLWSLTLKLDIFVNFVFYQKPMTESFEPGPFCTSMNKMAA